MLTLGDSPLKKIDIIFGLFAPVASVVVFVVGSGNYNTSNSGVEGIFVSPCLTMVNARRAAIAAQRAPTLHRRGLDMA